MKRYKQSLRTKTNLDYSRTVLSLLDLGKKVPRLHTVCSIDIIVNCILLICELQVDFSQNGDQGDPTPLPGKLCAKAAALTVTKALLDAGRQLVVGFADHALRSEDVRVFENIGVTVHLLEDSDYGLVVRNLVCAASQSDVRILVDVWTGFDVEARGDSGKTHGFAENGLGKLELRQVLGGQLAISTQNRVDFFAGFCDGFRALEEIVQGKREKTGRSGTANEQIDNFVDDSLVVERLAGLRVLTIEQGIEHVDSVLFFAFALGDNIGAKRTHGADFPAVAALVDEPVQKLGPRWTLDRFHSGTVNGREKGWEWTGHVFGLLVEETPLDALKVQSLQAICHVDLLFGPGSPGGHDRCNGIAHVVESGSVRLIGRPGGHDPVRDAPDALLCGIGREKRVVHGLSDLDNGPGDTFSETSLIADFLQQSSIGHEDNLRAESIDFEDWP